MSEKNILIKTYNSNYNNIKKLIEENNNTIILYNKLLDKLDDILDSYKKYLFWYLEKINKIYNSLYLENLGDIYININKNILEFKKIDEDTQKILEQNNIDPLKIDEYKKIINDFIIKYKQIKESPKNDIQKKNDIQEKNFYNLLLEQISMIDKIKINNTQIKEKIDSININIGEIINKFNEILLKSDNIINLFKE